MAIAWTTYRLLCCLTPELEPERCAFDAANARFAERVTMPEGILFALASPRSDFNPQINRNGLESNIRFCDFFVQIFGEAAPDPAFRDFVNLGIACAVDPAFPLRSTVVLFRNPENAAEPTAAFREELRGNPHCTVHDFHDSTYIDALAETILSDWHAMLQEPVQTRSATG